MVEVPGGKMRATVGGVCRSPRWSLIFGQLHRRGVVKVQVPDKTTTFEITISVVIDLVHPYALQFPKLNDKQRKLIARHTGENYKKGFPYRVFDVFRWQCHIDDDNVLRILNKGTQEHYFKPKLHGGAKALKFKPDEFIPGVEYEGSHASIGGMNEQRVDFKWMSKKDSVSVQAAAYQPDARRPIFREVFSAIILPPKKPEPKAEPKPKFKTEKFIFGPFETGKSDWKRIDKKARRKVRKAMNKDEIIGLLKRSYPKTYAYFQKYSSPKEKAPAMPLVRITGYADNRWHKDENKSLSIDRAKSVKKILLNDLGGKANWYQTKGLGERVPNKDGEKGQDEPENRVALIEIEVLR